MTDRQAYLDALRAEVEPNIVAHSIAVEACMGGIHDFLREQGRLGLEEPPREDWLCAGLIHDIDYGGAFKEQHTQKTREALAKHGLEISDSVHRIVLAHAPELTGVQPVTKAQWAIFCVDSLTGLIAAVALVYPSRKLADVKLSSVMKRFLKEPRFASGTRRAEVALCSRDDGLNIPLETFIGVCLRAMQGVAAEIGL